MNRALSGCDLDLLTDLPGSAALVKVLPTSSR